MKLPILSLLLTFRGISFHSLNKKYEERSWALLQSDLSILKSLAWRFGKCGLKTQYYYDNCDPKGH